MKRLYTCYLSILLMAGLPTFNVFGDDQIENVRKHWESQKGSLEKQWEELRSNIDKEWDNLEKVQQERWSRLKAEVEQKWELFVYSTKKDWVDYNQQKDTRSKVDFEKGRIVFEAVIPADDPEAMKKAQRKINDQTRKVFSQEYAERQRILENQVINKKGDWVASSNLKRYIIEEVLPEVKPDPLTFQSRDVVKRRRYSVHIDLVPKHIRIRAERYLPIVEKNAKRFDLKPQIVLAIIHTESYFNPKAISQAKAIGLMQIIPRYAGREAYRFINKEDKVITWQFLYNPENNIELGSAYLHLLKYKHFTDVMDELKNNYVSICGYNWGPNSMRKKIVDKYPINNMSDSEVYMLLRQKTPKETRNYIKKVIERIPIYDLFFGLG